MKEKEHTWEIFNKKARMAIMLAHEEAMEMGCRCVGTEHLLLGLINVAGSRAVCILNGMRVNLDEIRPMVKEFNQVLRKKQGLEVTRKDILYSPRMVKTIEIAFHESLLLNQKRIGTEHLLFGMVSQKKSVASRVLKLLGAPQAAILAEVADMTGMGISEDEPEEKLTPPENKKQDENHASDQGQNIERS